MERSIVESADGKNRDTGPTLPLSHQGRGQRTPLHRGQAHNGQLAIRPALNGVRHLGESGQLHGGKRGCDGARHWGESATSWDHDATDARTQWMTQGEVENGDRERVTGAQGREVVPTSTAMHELYGPSQRVTQAHARARARGGFLCALSQLRSAGNHVFGGGGLEIFSIGGHRHVREEAPPMGKLHFALPGLGGPQHERFRDASRVGRWGELNESASQRPIPVRASGETSKAVTASLPARAVIRVPSYSNVSIPKYSTT